MTKKKTIAYSVVINGDYTAATYEKLRQATRHVKTLGGIVNIDGSNYAVKTVEIVKQTYTTIASFSPQQTTIFVADNLDLGLTDLQA